MLRTPVEKITSAADMLLLQQLQRVCRLGGIRLGRRRAPPDAADVQAQQLALFRLAVVVENFWLEQQQ